MAVLEFMEQKMWERHEKDVLEAQRELQKKLQEPLEGGLIPEKRVELAILAASKVVAQILPVAKTLWIFESDSGYAITRKQEIGRALAVRLLAANSRIVEASCAGSTEKDANSVRKGALEAISQLTSDVLAEYQSSEHPLKNHEVKSMVSSNKASYNPRIKILLLSADSARSPGGSRPPSALNLDTEHRQIEQSIQKAMFRDQIDLVHVLAVTARDFIESLNRHRPQIVHFSGHGKRNAGIAFQAENGEPEIVNGAFLAEVFATRADDVRMVVLNACFSHGQAQAIASVIPVTIGTPGMLSDDVATEFSAALYGGLADGCSVHQAYQQAATLLENLRGVERPVILHQPDVNLETFFLVRTLDAEVCRQLAHDLNDVARRFFVVDKKLMDLLDSATLFCQSIEACATRLESEVSMPEGIFARLECLEEMLAAEVERVDGIIGALDEIERTWGRYLSQQAVGKLVFLRRAVVQGKKPVVSFSASIDHIIKKILGLRTGTGSLSSIGHENDLELIKCLHRLRLCFKANQNNIGIHYNQLLEDLPRRLLEEKRVRPVEMTL